MAGSEFSFLHDDLQIAQVIEEDEDFLTLKVIKNQSKTIHLEGGERFNTLVFLKNVEGVMVAWTPWKDA